MIHAGGNKVKKFIAPIWNKYQLSQQWK